jgi:hypothetical protein
VQRRIEEVGKKGEFEDREGGKNHLIRDDDINDFGEKGEHAIQKNYK